MSYTSLDKLLSAIKKADLSQGKLADIEKSIERWGFENVDLTEG